MHLAAFAGHEDVVMYLLDVLDGDVLSRKNYSGKTGLDLAREKGHVNVADKIERVI